MNYLIAFLLVTFISLISILVSRTGSIGKLFIGFFSASTTYYGVLGVWYWSEYRDSTFLGTYWGDVLKDSMYDYVFVHLLVCVSFVAFGARYFWSNPIQNKKGAESIYHKQVAFGGRLSCEKRPHSFNREKRYFPKIMEGMISSNILIIAAFASMYTLLVGGSLVNAGKALSADSLLLIMYQFSDLSVSVLLYKIALGQRMRLWILVSMIFTMYFMYVGFRYKIVLLWVPLVILWYFISPISKPRKIFAIISVCLIGIASLSLMTIVRTKFGGMSLDGLASADADRLFYSFFAESNIEFGWISAKNLFGADIPYAGVTPFVEIFEQFIPRFLYEDKALYQHLWSVNYGLGDTAEAASSGTAMPFFGEYFASAGYFGLIVGVLIYAYTVRRLLLFVGKKASSFRLYIVGVGLIIVFFGYYYYSRGSIAQISKGFLFIIFPYLYFMRRNG